MNETNVKILSCSRPLNMVGSRKLVRKDALSLPGRVIKRMFDFVVSLVGLIVFSPFLAVISFCIKKEDGASAIFKQERIGYKGKPFVLYKFRSMTMAAEADGKPALCKKEDKRLTKIGKFLLAGQPADSGIRIAEYLRFTVKLLRHRGCGELFFECGELLKL